MAFEILNDNIKPPETGLQKVTRAVPRVLARGAEAVVGLPGDIASGVLGLTNLGIQKATGQPSPLPSRLPIPTSEDIKENVTKPLTGETLEPQTPGEEFWDNVFADAATILVPLKGKVPFQKALGGALAKSAVGNYAKWGAEEVTGSPLIGAATKVGAMALAGTAGGRKQLNSIRDNTYKEAFSNLPEAAKFNFLPEKTKLSALKAGFSKSRKPESQLIVNEINAFENLLSKNNRGSINDIIKIKQDWNDLLGRNDFDRAAKPALKRLVGIAKEGIDRYGKTNESFYQPYKIGEELQGALKSTSYLQDFLGKSPLLTDGIKNPIVKYLLVGGTSYGLLKRPIALTTAAGIGAGLYGAREGARAYQLLAKSPYARQYYKNLIEASLKNDTKAVAKNIANLDNIANKFEKQFPALPSQESNRYELLD